MSGKANMHGSKVVCRPICLFCADCNTTDVSPRNCLTCRRGTYIENVIAKETEDLGRKRGIYSPIFKPIYTPIGKPEDTTKGCGILNLQFNKYFVKCVTLSEQCVLVIGSLNKHGMLTESLDPKRNPPRIDSATSKPFQ
jgi:hypothetical protein